MRFVGLLAGVSLLALSSVHASADDLVETSVNEPNQQHGPGQQHAGPVSRQDRGDDQGRDKDRDQEQKPCPSCEVKTKQACFNLVCHYEFDGDSRSDQRRGEGLRSCQVATTFVKAVTPDGGEVRDDSAEGTNPSLEVSCDGRKIEGNSARRFTDLLGTRIQGLTGPTPAILLPRGTLHSGAESRSGSHYAPSILELDSENRLVRAKGSCFIWTGQP